jgi:hypothetical protein
MRLGTRPIVEWGSVMRRRLFILVWASCVLVTLALGAMWMRSYFAGDEVSWWSAADAAGRSEWTKRSIAFGRGQFRVDYRSGLDIGRWANPSGVTPGFRYEATKPYATYGHIDGPPADFEKWGVVFDYDHHVRPNALGDGEFRWLSVMIVLPIWPVMSIFAVASAWPFIGMVKRGRRRKSGRCVVCGYDLRASPSRCPECGAVFGQPAGA